MPFLIPYNEAVLIFFFSCSAKRPSSAKKRGPDVIRAPQLRRGAQPMAMVVLLGSSFFSCLGSEIFRMPSSYLADTSPASTSPT